MWFVLAEVFEDSRRPYLPWLMIGVSLWVIAYGVREWTRNGSLTARRVKSVEERERDERANRRLLKWQAARFALAVGFLLVILVVALFR